MRILPSKCHKDVLELQRIGHFGPFNPNASRIGVLRLMVESAGQSDGATAMCHHFTRSCLHYHRSGVVLCGRKEKEEEGRQKVQCAAHLISAQTCHRITHSKF